MISNTVIVLITCICFYFIGDYDGSNILGAWAVASVIAILFDWFSICMKLNRDKRESGND